MISEMLKHILWAAIGAGAGYYVAKKHLEADFDSRLQHEVEKTRTFYKNMYEEKLRRATEISHNEGAIQAVIDLITDGEELQIDVFYNFVKEHLHIFKEQEYTTLDQAWVLYKSNAEVLGLRNTKSFSQFREELKGYFEEFHERKTFGDKDERNVFVGFIMNRDEAETESEELPEEAAVALVNYQGISAASTEPVGNVSRLIVKKAEEEQELSYVKPDGPRIIDFATYAANGGDYRQETVVFYAKDSIVSNERDEKLTENFVGTHISYANLSKLNDETTTIYIRDDKHGMDHEVIRSASSYSVDVLGEQPE